MSEAIIPQPILPGAGVVPPHVEDEPVRPHAIEPAELVQPRTRPSIGTRVAGLIVAAEMSPANEVARFGAFGAAMAATGGDGLVATAVGAATSLALEVGATFAGAHYYPSEHGAKRIEKVKDLLLRFKLGALATKKTDVLADTGIALIGGSAVLLGAKHLQNPERTKAQDIKAGTIAALGVSAVTAVQTGLMASGWEAAGTPGIIGAAGVAIIGVSAANKVVKKRLRARAERRAGEGDSLISVDDAETVHNVAPRYDLSHEELSELEASIVEKAKSAKGIGLRGLTAVWIDGNSEYANFMRTHEDMKFPDDHVPELFAGHEESSKFLALVDTRRGRSRVIRGTRFTTPRVAEEDGATKMAMIEGMVESGQFTEEEFTEHYRKRGVDVDECLSIETNFRIGARAPRALGFIPAASLAYFTAYNYAVQGDRKARNVAIFAHINQASVNSLDHLGVDVEPLMDDEALWTPAVSKKDRDLAFKPVALLNTPKTASTMKRLAAFAPREVRM